MTKMTFDRRRVGINDVAQSLGLSVSTVSRALNGYADVNAQTRQRIEDEARRLGYQASNAGRKLRHGRASAVGFVLPPAQGELSDPVFLPFLAGVDVRLREAGLQLIITTASSREDDLQRTQALVNSDQVDAMILVRVQPDDPRVAFLIERGVPFSMLGLSRIAPSAPSVEIDHEDAVHQAVRWLAAQGRRVIAHINVPTQFTYGQTRKAAFASALHGAGLDVIPDLEVEGDFSEYSGIHTAEHLLRQTPQPDGIVCGKDAMAFGVAQALVRANLKPGKDISLIGFGDIATAALMNPPLTTFRVPFRDIGMLVADNLLRFMAGEDSRLLSFRPKPTLVIRET